MNRRIRSKDLETDSVNARVLAAGAIEGRHLASPALRRLADTGTLDPDALEAGGVTAPKIGERAVEARNIALGAIEVAAFAQGIRPISIVDELPDLPDGAYPTGALVFLTTDDKVYRNASGTWTQRTDVDDLEGLIEARHIAAGAIETDQLAANSISAGKIQAGAIGTDELAANSISAGKIQADAVGAEQLAAIRLEVGKYISSFNYDPGVAGWAGDADGNFELNSATIRNGVLVGGSFTAGGGDVVIDDDGISISSGIGARQKITWSNGTTLTHDRLQFDGGGWIEATGLTLGSNTGLTTIFAGFGQDIDMNAAAVRVSGQLVSEGHEETTAGANCNISTSGVIRRDTSIRAAKADLTGPTDDDLAAVRLLRPVTYRSVLAADDPALRHWGLIAEDVAAVDDRLVHLDEDGNPSGVAYDRIVAPLLAWVGHLEARLDAAGVA